MLLVAHADAGCSCGRFFLLFNVLLDVTQCCSPQFVALQSSVVQWRYMSTGQAPQALALDGLCCLQCFAQFSPAWDHMRLPVTGCELQIQFPSREGYKPLGRINAAQSTVHAGAPAAACIRDDVAIAPLEVLRLKQLDHNPACILAFSGTLRHLVLPRMTLRGARELPAVVAALTLLQVPAGRSPSLRHSLLAITNSDLQDVCQAV